MHRPFCDSTPSAFVSVPKIKWYPLLHSSHIPAVYGAVSVSAAAHLVQRLAELPTFVYDDC